MELETPIVIMTGKHAIRVLAMPMPTSMLSSLILPAKTRLMAEMKSESTKLIMDGIMIFMILHVICEVILPSDC